MPIHSDLHHASLIHGHMNMPTKGALGTTLAIKRQHPPCRCCSSMASRKASKSMAGPFLDCCIKGSSCSRATGSSAGALLLKAFPTTSIMHWIGIWAPSVLCHSYNKRHKGLPLDSIGLIFTAADMMVLQACLVCTVRADSLG